MFVNKNGLSRSLPAEVALAVRQKCGFGCIVCGQAICDYEHVEPEFSEAIFHDPDGIVLLCPGCHARVTRKFWSKDFIKSAAKNPKSKALGFSFDTFDIGPQCPTVVIGNIYCEKVRCIIKINEDEIFSVRPPEFLGGPFLLSAKIMNDEGSTILQIKDNIFYIRDSSWDIRVYGGRIKIFSKSRNMVFYLKTENPGKIIIEKLSMTHKNVRILAKENHPTYIIMPWIGLEASAWAVNGHDVALNFAGNRLTIGEGLSPYRDLNNWGVSLGQTRGLSKEEFAKFLVRRR